MLKGHINDDVRYCNRTFRVFLPLFVITGAFLAIGAIGSGILPEQRALEFSFLTDFSIASDMKVIIKEPTLEDNTSITQSTMLQNVA